VLLRAGRAAASLMPPRLCKSLEDRAFYAVFNVTRVTNDAYGWRPPPPGPVTPDSDEAGPDAPR